nr:hypothetical protein [Angustibacter aerolatus]
MWNHDSTTCPSRIAQTCARWLVVDVDAGPGGGVGDERHRDLVVGQHAVHVQPQRPLGRRRRPADELQHAVGAGVGTGVRAAAGHVQPGVRGE